MNTAGLLDEQRVRQNLERVLRQRTGTEAQLGALKRFPVGYSWLTYGFSTSWQGEARELILRLGPPNGLFAPYSAVPQFVTLQAVRGSGVPVPAVHWHGDNRPTSARPGSSAKRFPAAPR